MAGTMLSFLRLLIVSGSGYFFAFACANLNYNIFDTIDRDTPIYLWRTSAVYGTPTFNSPGKAAKLCQDDPNKPSRITDFIESYKNVKVHTETGVLQGTKTRAFLAFKAGTVSGDPTKYDVYLKGSRPVLGPNEKLLVNNYGDIFVNGIRRSFSSAGISGSIWSGFCDRGGRVGLSSAHTSNCDNWGATMSSEFGSLYRTAATGKNAIWGRVPDCNAGLANTCRIKSALMCVTY